MLADNLHNVKETIASALARRTERKETGDEVCLVAVTKNHPAAVVTEIQSLGVGNIGENRVQEAREKQQQIGHPGKWHLIGHLQTNKAKQAVEFFDLIESADSEHLLRALEKEAAKQGKVMDVLLQINVAREPQKTGFLPEDYEAVLPLLDSFPHIRVRGIMVIAPNTPDQTVLHSVFRQGYDYFCKLKRQRKDIDFLSMGMTSDYAIAVEEGANMVRVGTALFGARDYNNRGY
ncbi:MAG: YggS family pyridoxal phosphate-dependent enzyme [Acidaminococcaceae bacterium]|jgi:pyridoxal phosphate enzyme (YggS family)|nr:YggS family pyridoxal phosphate-dependent enzyme [Acidaminococcaceae bacterium]MBQ2139668.1 YggS family pyridoxal phosphate-dependent enzyme [Acidaminococcaceae bacterium]MBQ2342853.1 YggS family pyridoxal phosphate-dependent enzyme [Acidaminococcaceae bacterium]